MNPPRPLRLFLAAQAILYLAFLALDLLGVHAALSDGLKYVGVALCFLAALAWAGRDGLQGRLQAAAAGFTLLADLFLLLLDRWYLAGVLSFWVVQALYLARIRSAGGWPRPVCLAVRLALPAAALLFLWTGGALSPLNAASAVYFSQLLCSAAESAALPGRVPWAGPFRAGLWLFVGCDLCVALHNLTAATGLSLPLWLGRAASLGMWAFYLPSQVLLTLSGRTFAKEGPNP